MNVIIDIYLNDSLQEPITFQEQKQFSLDIAETKEENFEFTYDAISINLSGSVIINDSGILHDVELGTVIAISSNLSDTAAISEGQYQLFNMDLDNYDITFSTYLLISHISVH